MVNEVTRSSINQEPTKREEKKDLPKVMGDGKVIQKEKSGAQTFKENFFKEDLKTVRNAIITEVLIPKAQEMLMSIVNNALSMWLTGNKATVAQTNPNATRISFVDYSAPFNKPKTVAQHPAQNHGYLSQVVVPVPSEEKGKKLIETICDVMEQYHNLSVNDLYDIIGCAEEVPSTMCNYGWKDRELRKIRLDHDRDGWYVTMPEMVVI